MIEEPASHFSVLVVDDDEMLNMLICTYLENDGFKTISAYSVSEAKKLIQICNDIDVILLDYQLGDGEGIELLRFNDEVPFIDKSPVIVISANDNVDFLEGCFSWGASDYIIKPINFKLLSLKAKNLIQSIKLKNIINVQYKKLTEYKENSEQEEAVAKFTYEYLVKRANQLVDGVNVWQRSFSAFSGDIVLVRISPAGDLFLIMADATGHGLSAAITVMPLISTFNSMVSKGFHLQLIVAEINRKLSSDTPDDRFVAAIAMEFSPSKGMISVWNGGMPPVLVVDNKTIVHEFKSRHLALGILEDEFFEAAVEEFSYTGNETLLMCSDGLLEQQNPDGEAYGRARLNRMLGEHSESLVNAVVDDFMGYVLTSNYADDVSICTMDLKQVLGSPVLQEKQAAAEILEGKCVWNLRLSGATLGNIEVMPLVQQLSQHLNIHQSLRQKLFVVVSEMVANALDHGVLGLTSDLKEMENGFMEYHSERMKRLAMIDPQSFISLTLACENTADGFLLTINVEDSGKGYEQKVKNSSEGSLNSGRGLTLIRKLSSSVRVEPPGNKIEAVLS